MHTHQFKDWPFCEPDNTAAFTCSHVFDGASILLVTHDTEDGAWQFLCGQVHESDDSPRIVCLGCIAEKDNTLLELADLPLGWCAERKDKYSQWIREPHEFLSEDDHDIE